MTLPISPAIRRRHRLFRWRNVTIVLATTMCAVLLFLATTDNAHIWPYRNTLQYYLFRRLGLVAPPPTGTHDGVLAGTVRDPAGHPIVGARVLVAAIDGTPWSAESDATGAYRIAGVPPGRYAPVAGARGFEDTAIRRAGLFRIGIGSAVSQVDITLKPLSPPAVVRETNWSLSPAQTVSLTDPLPGSAVEHEVHYVVDGKPNQTTFYYTPVEGSDRLPTILAVYPGPADTWAQVSIPLAQAGFAVIAVGPAYALDLEPDVDDLQRLIARLQAGDFPRADPDRMGVIAGSYSSLHVFRLAERQVTGVRAILLLGPPTDLFELRRQFEAGTFFPPFGLDQVLVALGLPDRAPERYWRYSVRYHVRSIDVPVMLIHSKLDEIIPFTQSQLMADELQRLGKPYELHILEGMGHYLLEPKRTPAIDDLFRTTTDFFAHQLAAKP